MPLLIELGNIEKHSAQDPVLASINLVMHSKLVLPGSCAEPLYLKTPM